VEGQTLREAPGVFERGAMAVTDRLAQRTFDRSNIASQDDLGMAARKTTMSVHTLSTKRTSE
jgi:hypothetical protein